MTFVRGMPASRPIFSREARGKIFWYVMLGAPARHLPDMTDLELKHDSVPMIQYACL